MNISCRAARKSDFAAIADILERCFDSVAPGFFRAQTEHDSTFRLRHARVAVLGGRPIGYVRIFARTMLVRGRALPAGGIGSVATHPGAQHRGVATALLRDAIAQMRGEGMALSFLFTGIPGFYERLGYRVVRQPQITLPRPSIAAAAAPAARTVRVRTMVLDRDLAALLRLHEAATADATGAVLRTARTWLDATQWLGERPGPVAHDAGGRIAAYMRSRCRDYGHEVLEAECAAGAESSLLPLLAAAVADCDCAGIVAWLATTHSLAAQLRALKGASETTEVLHPMMVRALTDDAALDDAFDAEPLRFWNCDRI
jgi:predicted N-acetyltransferase YhbS